MAGGGYLGMKTCALVSVVAPIGQPFRRDFTTFSHGRVCLSLMPRETVTSWLVDMFVGKKFTHFTPEGQFDLFPFRGGVCYSMIFCSVAQTGRAYSFWSWRVLYTWSSYNVFFCVFFFLFCFPVAGVVCLSVVFCCCCC